MWSFISMTIVLVLAQYLLNSPAINFILSLLGGCLACLYILYDIQLIFEGDHERANKLGIDDYIRAALLVYMDVVYLFLKVIQILGERK